MTIMTPVRLEEAANDWVEEKMTMMMVIMMISIFSVMLGL
jgi:hypothetical protein